ncbi:MAG: multiple sugar transport system substrate-binding protein [Thermomicrobiales bacterium]|nr:multiple sugar transport system substrate-binding protein [Thermomicrobiales bacterium]
MGDDRVIRLIEEARTLRYSRRGILRRGAVLGLSTPAIATVLGATGQAAAAPARSAPALQSGGKLTILAGSYFVPEAQTFFDEQVKGWGQQNGVEVTTDYVNWPDIQPKISAAVESGSGPDIVELRDPWPYLYYEQLVDLNDLATKAGEDNGGFYEWATNTVAVDGKWYSVPVGTSSTAFAYRTSYLQQAGIADPATQFPKTWEELFALGKELKAMGKPLGQAFGHSTGDPPQFAYSYMWSYGAMEVEEDGKTVAFNKPEFLAAMETLIRAWKDGFDETGLSWDDSANNRAFLSDQLSATINGSSIYLAAQKAKAGIDPGTDYQVVVDPADIGHADMPGGPAGRFNVLGSWSYGILKYSKNQEAAKALLQHWLAPEQFRAWLQAQKGYIIPPGPTFVGDPVFTEDPKLAPYLNVVNYGRNKGYAGPANDKAARSFSQYVVVDTFAKAIQSGDAKGAIEEGARLLERIYSR